MTPRQSFCFSSCAIPRESGKCRRASGSRQKPNSPSCSTKGSFKRDGSTRPAHKIPDTPRATRQLVGKADASYFNLAKKSYNFGDFSGDVFEVKQNGFIANIGLIYRFNPFAPAPVLIAKYEPEHRLLAGVRGPCRAPMRRRLRAVPLMPGVL
jgi:hypothetical protein